MSARVAPGWATRAVTVGAVLLVAAVAAVVSFAHMREVAERAGEDWRAWLLPLSVDGLVVAGSMVLLTRRRAGLAGGRLAWGALLGGVGASLAANVAAADPTTTARLVASWPAVAFALSFELLLEQRREPVAEPVADQKPPADRPEVFEGEDRPGIEPVIHQPVGPPDFPHIAREVPPEPVVERAADPADADLVERVRRAVDVDGRTPGRRTLARQLGVSEYRVRKILDLPATNGRGTR